MAEHDVKNGPRAADDARTTSTAAMRDSALAAEKAAGPLDVHGVSDPAYGDHESPTLNPYIIAMGEGDHGHWGRGTTKAEARAAMPCVCVKDENVTYWRTFAPPGKVPYVDNLGRIHSWAEPVEVA